MGNKFNKDKCGSDLRQAVTRMNIHRQKKLTGIAKTKDDICKHLSSQNEINAKIWCETLINEENMIPCYDITVTMCDQVRGRLEYISKFGAPPDMTQTFATITHAAPKLGVEELMKVRKQFESLLGKEFILQADEDKNFINPVVAANIDFKKPDDGEVVYKMCLLAKDRNIQYTPSHDLSFALNDYLERKSLDHPMGGDAQRVKIPVYNPQISVPSVDQNPPPPNFPQNNGGSGVPGYGGQGVPSYDGQVAPLIIVNPNGQVSNVIPQQQYVMPPQMYQPPVYPEQNPGVPFTNAQQQQPSYHYDPHATLPYNMPPQQPPSFPSSLPQQPKKDDPDNIDDLEARLRALNGL